MIKITFTILITMYLAGCVSTIEPLDGLCFNVKDNTYMCDKPERKRKQPEEEMQEWIDKIEDDVCDDDMKTWHGHCIDEKYRNIA